jgi:hypothetical protein
MNVLNCDLYRLDWRHVQTVEPSGSPTTENCVRHPAIDGGQLEKRVFRELCPSINATLHASPARTGQLLLAQARESGLFDGENPRSQFERDERLSTHDPKACRPSGCEATLPVKNGPSFRAKTVEFAVSKHA